MFSTLPRYNRIREGFSLIEAAIVLGIIGLVIGGIWVAASSAVESKRISDTLLGTTQLIANLRAQYAHVDMVAQQAETAYCHEDPTVFSNVVGFEWVNMYNIKDAWGKGIACYFETTPVGFALIFYQLNKAACMRVMSFWGSKGDQLDHLQSPGSFISNFPYTPVASIDCPTEDNRVSFLVKL